MRLPFQRAKDTPAPDQGRAAARVDGKTVVEAARSKARQRLLGALVLLAVAVIGFPLLFETQPRPLPLDTPIEILRSERNPAVKLQVPAPEKIKPVTLPPPDAGIEGAPAAAASSAAQAPMAGAASAPALKVVPKPAPKPESAVVALVTSSAQPAAVPSVSPTASTAAAARPVVPPPVAHATVPTAQPAATPPSASSVAKTGRFVVQAGAYTDPGSLRDARQKVEKLGLKTYTQVIESDAGKRTRVRVGPFETRQEAEAVAARVKAAGLQVSVLTL